MTRERADGRSPGQTRASADSSPGLDVVYRVLRDLMARDAEHLSVASDEPGNFSLDGGWDAGRRKLRWFGGVQLKKHYVSYHLMAVYAFPTLVEGVSETLRARMHGKSCFNFTRIDPAMAAELSVLTRRCAERFAEEGWLEPPPGGQARQPREP